MTAPIEPPPSSNESIVSVRPDGTIDKNRLQAEVERAINTGKAPAVARFLLNLIGGAIPFVGGALSGAANTWAEAEQARVNQLIAAWMRLQEDELKEIGATLIQVVSRLDHSDPHVTERLESREYLSIVKKALRDWSAAESEEKRRAIGNLLANAAASRLCSDDVVKLFIEWIAHYSEAHFQVIRAIYRRPGSTRREIWQQIHGANVREDSADADLFKLLIRDLSTGSIIRQHREKDYHGNFIQKSRKARSAGSGTMASAFDDEQEYELTELGKQFVHYTMNEVVPKLAASSPP